MNETLKFLLAMLPIVAIGALIWVAISSQKSFKRQAILAVQTPPNGSYYDANDPIRNAGYRAGAPMIDVQKSQLSMQQLLLLQSMTQTKIKSPSTAVILCLLLGGLGIHKFYLGQIGLGFLYLLFCWSFIPAIVSLFEAFFISGYVKKSNEAIEYTALMQIRAMTSSA